MTDHGIQKLTDYSHVRLKTEMYLGSRSPHTQETIIYSEKGIPKIKELTWVPALYTFFREALDNAIDEVIGHNSGDRIDVTVDPKTLTISIEDNGRGIPIDFDTDHKEYLATMVLTNARAGRNFGERGEVAGTNGIGISACNFCSEFMNLEIWRDKKKFTQSFKENPLPNGDSLNKNKAKIIDISSGKTGTKITFKPSALVFDSLILPEEFIKSRVFEIAISNPLIKIYYNGERLKVSPYVEKTLFPNIKPIILDIIQENIRSKFYIIPNFTDSGETIHTLVNNIPAFNGGVHIDLFRRSFYSTVLQALEGPAKRRKVTPNRSDINDGLLIYNITQMKAPDFDSQSKTRLINEWVGKAVQQQVSDPELIKRILARNKEWVEMIFARAEERSNKKAVDETKKAAKSAKRAKVAGLLDATGRNREDCILFLAEGLSAISGMSSVRDPQRHGGLGLSGKILNINGEVPKKILDNKVLVDIMNALGLMIGEPATRSFMRYGKVFIAADMDADGMNITALLVNFFHTYWPELFDPKKEPFVHVFMTPFIIAEKGKQRKYWYAHNYSEFNSEEYKGWSVTRAKGLGTLTKEDWAQSLDHPVSVPLIDDGKLKESLDLVFNGKRSDDRKNWIAL